MSSNNRLQVLPEFILQLQKLAELDISFNNMPFLLENIGYLARLERLYLGSNRFSILPVSIGQLTSLQVLDASSNILTILPNELGNCQSLVKLDLSKNRLAELPLSLAQLDNLVVQFFALFIARSRLVLTSIDVKTLELGANVLIFPPPAIAEQGVKAVKQYLIAEGVNKVLRFLFLARGIIRSNNL